MAYKPTSNRVILKRLPRKQDGPLVDMSERVGPEEVEVVAAADDTGMHAGQHVWIGAWGGTIIKGDLLIMNANDVLATVEAE